MHDSPGIVQRVKATTPQHKRVSMPKHTNTTKSSVSLSHNGKGSRHSALEARIRGAQEGVALGQDPRRRGGHCSKGGNRMPEPR